MKMTEVGYKYIIGQLATAHCTDSQLNSLKYRFRDEIDSARRYDTITTLKALIRVLVKRDIINAEAISVLSFLASTLERNDLINLINSYGLTKKDLSVTERTEDVTLHGTQRKVLPHVSKDPIERIDDLISKEIGQKWIIFARKLKIGEGYIDELEQRYMRISDMVLEVLSYHRENCDERLWKVNLCQALRDARRNDLSIRVEQIFALYGLM